MTEIVPFSFPATGHQVRTLTMGDEHWFVAVDICAVLEIGNPRMAVARLDEDDVSTTDVIDSMGRTQRTNIVSESGLYELVFQSRKPEAKSFKRWITHEVLPAIRRTGSYAVTPAQPVWQVPQTLAAALLLAAELEMDRADAVKRAEDAEHLALAAGALINELEPAAEAWDILASANGDYSVREAAYILNRDPAIFTGERRLFASIRELGMVSRGDVPYSRHAKHLSLRPRSYTCPRTGEERNAKPQLRVTVDGLGFLHRHLGGQQPLRFDQIVAA